MYGRFLPSSGVELKTFDHNDADYALVAGETFNLLNLSAVGIARGSGPSQRIGNRITIKSMEFAIRVRAGPVASGDPNQRVVAYVILDTQANGAKPSPADVFGTIDAATGQFALSGAGSLHAFRNLTNSKRFSTLKKFEINPNQYAPLTSYTAFSKYQTAYKKCNIPIEYDASVSTGMISSIRTNNIFLCMFGSSDNDLEVTLLSRYRYSDA